MASWIGLSNTRGKIIAFYIAGVQMEKVDLTKKIEFPSTMTKWGVQFYFEESNRSVFFQRQNKSLCSICLR